MAGAMPAGALQFLAYESAKSNLNRALTNSTALVSTPHSPPPASPFPFSRFLAPPRILPMRVLL
eukprot:1216623-Rhodomonas_salina.2